MSDHRADAVAALHETWDATIGEASEPGTASQCANCRYALDAILANPRHRAALLAVLLDPETLATALRAHPYGYEPPFDQEQAERIIARLTATDSTEPGL